MDDATAYMELVRANAQGELTALERGMHALHSGMDGKAYAASLGRPQRSVASEIAAARIASTVADVGYDLTAHFSQLVEIHAAPSWLWPALVSRMVAESLTVEATRKLVASFKDIAEPPKWSEQDMIATAKRPLRLVAADFTEAALGADTDYPSGSSAVDRSREFVMRRDYLGNSVARN